MLLFTKMLIGFKTDISVASTKLIVIFSQKYYESLHGFDISHLSPGAHIKLYILPKTM